MGGGFSGSTFHKRLAAALRLRLYPNSNLHLKQLAAAIDRSEHTISRWWRGESRPLAEDIGRLAAFFAKRGDRDFLKAIFGEALGTAEPISDARLLEFLRDLLGRAPTQNSADARHLWFTKDGVMAPAPFGLSAYVSATVPVPPPGDLVRYAVSLLGWVAATIEPDDVVVLRHDGRRMAVHAAERACEWLRSGQVGTRIVRRAIHIDGEWFDAEPEAAELAATALEQAAAIDDAARRPWTIKRLALDKVRHPRLLKLLRVHHQTPAKIIHAAADMGALTVSGVFAIDGENVISHHVPTEYRDLDPSLIEGKNVLSRADIDYALMLQARMLTAKREGVIYHELSGSNEGNALHYVSLAMAEPGPRGRVLSSTVILEKRPI